MEFEDINKKLIENIDLKYKKFNENLLPGVDNIQGIRVPILRSIAKEIYRESDYIKFLNEYKEDYYEEIILKGFVIGLMKPPKNSIEEILYYTNKFIPKIYNWAVCDSFCSSLKITKKYREEFLMIVEENVSSEEEYDVRFSLVMLLAHYVEEDYLESIFKLINLIKVDYYYVDMALAWLLTEIYTKYPEELLDNLYLLNINKEVEKKMIRKVKDSFKISDENTEKLVYHINKQI